MVVDLPVVVDLPTACPCGCENCPAGGPFLLGGGVCATATHASAAQSSVKRKRIGVFMGFIAFIIFIRDLSAKVAEDFAAIGARIGVLGGVST